MPYSQIPSISIRLEIVVVYEFTTTFSDYQLPHCWVQTIQFQPSYDMTDSLRVFQWSFGLFFL